MEEPDMTLFERGRRGRKDRRYGTGRRYIRDSKEGRAKGGGRDIERDGRDRGDRRSATDRRSGRDSRNKRVSGRVTIDVRYKIKKSKREVVKTRDIADREELLEIGEMIELEEMSETAEVVQIEEIAETREL
ncbi:hypothetical protein ACROYT_G007407 [Oculina patagonica]